ncbi:MAG: RagB/SusD family nutrient uptake outer membrane protein [Paludibacter sp.]
MKTKNNFFNLSIVVFFCFGIISCTDYLDKSPDAGLTDADIFKSYDKYQGFIEDAYNCMTNPSIGFTVTNFNLGDDLLQLSTNYLSSINSDYRAWEGSQTCMFYAANGNKYNSNPYLYPNNSVNFSAGDGYSNLGFWDGSWLGIRKVNIALANLNKLVIPYKSAPLQEQKDLIEGQARFLRAYFHFQIIRCWGGMPYINKVLSQNDNLNFPRLSYHACSDSIEKDLLIAIEKLPINWDDTQTGQITKGTNEGRLTKGAAYALLGKVMLYAGSPLMNGTVTGDYNYNKDYCKKAVKYFGEVIKLSALGGGTTYDFLPWSNYSDNFYMYGAKIPGRGKEGILNTPNITHARRTHISDMLNSMGGWGGGCGPMENYVQYFGMNDGTSFDPNIYNTPTINPWANRDPRFYKNIVCDQQTLMKTNPATLAQFYLGGSDRGGAGKTDTGYGWQKFRDSTIWASGGANGWSNTLNRCLPVIRLADVYLMYAESVNEAFGFDADPATTAPAVTDCHISAWEAVKAVRDRVLNADGSQLPLPTSFFASTDALRETIRRERAVELAFEGHRWFDLRRWYVADKPEYMRIDVLDYDKAHTYFKVRSYAKKVFEKKHYWLPILDQQTQIFTSFSQNPGW